MHPYGDDTDSYLKGIEVELQKRYSILYSKRKKVVKSIPSVVCKGLGKLISDLFIRTETPFFHIPLSIFPTAAATFLLRVLTHQHYTHVRLCYGAPVTSSELVQYLFVLLSHFKQL